MCEVILDFMQIYDIEVAGMRLALLFEGFIGGNNIKEHQMWFQALKNSDGECKHLIVIKWRAVTHYLLSK